MGKKYYEINMLSFYETQYALNAKTALIND